MPRGVPKTGKRATRPPTKGSFKSGDDDPRRNTAGQRNKVAVAFNREIRAIIVEVGEEETTLPDGRKISKIEGVIRAAYKRAIEGDGSARDFIVERTEGKVNQGIDIILKMIDFSKLNEAQLERIANGENPVAVVLDGLSSAD